MAGSISSPRPAPSTSTIPTRRPARPTCSSETATGRSSRRSAMKRACLARCRLWSANSRATASSTWRPAIARWSTTTIWDGISGTAFRSFPATAKAGCQRQRPTRSGTLQPEYGWFDPSQPYQDNHHQLNTADLNGDGRTDLIASPGVIALNRPAAPNHPPVAFAGADRTAYDYDGPASFCAARVRMPTCTGSLTPGGTRQGRS